MNDEETIVILARWVAELRQTLDHSRRELHVETARAASLQRQVSAFGYWMRTGRTPACIRELACVLDETAA